MRLAGDLAEFSLPDLLQVKSAARQTAGLKILGPEGNGLIVLREGEVVHAQYEELVGAAAFHALMGVKAGYFEAAKLDGAVAPTVDQPMRELLLDAFRLAEEGKLPRPARRTPQSALVLEPRAGGSEERPAKRRSRLHPGLAALAAALLAAAVLVLLLPSASRTSPTSPTSAGSLPEAKAATPVFEASELLGAGDRPPELLVGVAPPAPADGAAVLPTVICRLRVDGSGSVAEAKVYRSRVEFEAFEELAIRAVQSYRFRPALRSGRPVSAWINVPVEFR
jgi:TonB family protein